MTQWTFSILLTGVKRVVDLCAAPGSWSQVLSKRLKYVKLVHVLFRPLQFNVLFLGPDRPYFLRCFLLILGSEVRFN